MSDEGDEELTRAAEDAGLFRPVADLFRGAIQTGTDDAGEDIGRDSEEDLEQDLLKEEAGKYPTAGMTALGKRQDALLDTVYLDEAERAKYLISVGDDGLLRDADGNLFDTTHNTSGMAIYVMDKDGNIYAGQEEDQVFQHSSFFAGGEVAGAGQMKVEAGRLTYLDDRAGHYKLERSFTRNVISELLGRGVDFDPETQVKWMPRRGGI
jgi:hypothetical protein